MSNEYWKRDVARAFGLALREACGQRGISPDQLSEICDVDRTYLSLVERGLRCPTLSMLLRLADVVAVGLSRLVAETVKRMQAT
jgi:transcriptional regulator with XRE-family HTH domain